uniref:RanBD1 domain-containing protein n=1 Tax=Caenorhabditis japonica TaxID=281687 RepID=A0A8R1DTU4_CAEJA
MSDNAAPKGFGKKSALAEKADKIWSESKTDYSATHPTVNHVHLEKKSLGDIALKETVSERKEKEVVEDVSPQTFVFGSKIADRVVKKDGDVEKPLSEEEKTLTATELFKSAVKKDEDKNGVKNFREEAEQEAERAKEAEKQHAGTSAVEVTTGEEADTNIFQATSKIWVFDKAKNAYTEKGVCTLRINKRLENGLTHHRIVARTTGTLRVIINSKIFSDMLLERVDKRIRISAMGPEISGVQIFLLKIGFTKTETVSEADSFYNIMSDLLKLEKGENSRKRKADCDLNASSVKIKDGKDDEEEVDQVDEGFVIVNKPTDEEVKASEEKPRESSSTEPTTATA